MEFEDLQKLAQSRPELDLERLRKAYEYAKTTHSGQFRKTGEPYITHPLSVAYSLVELGADEDTVCAGLLHDVIEEADDVEEKERDLFEHFGAQVHYLVQALSKDYSLTDRLERHNNYVQQLKHALEIDISIFFLKVVDMLHNLSTLEALKPEKQDKWIHELKYEYLPLFADFFHSIPSQYDEMYHRLIEKIQKIIDSYEKKRNNTV